SMSGFPTDTIAKPIAAAATTKMLVLRIRDQITALSRAMTIPGCSGSSARSERKRGKGLSGVKSSFVGIGRCLLITLVDQYPAIDGQKATIAAKIWEKP